MNETLQERPIITLTTDFGLGDDYVGTVKGVILSYCRNAVIVDLTHEIAAQNIADAAMNIAHSYRFFPPGTVHVVVVDPGVGSNRKILALRACGHLFIAPDNGVLETFFEEDRFEEAFIIKNENLFAESVSRTFHGRDIMAPVAARLACGLDITRVGPRIAKSHCYRIRLPKASLARNTITGEIIHADHFGNLRTSITKEDIASFSRHRPQIKVADHIIDGISTAYSDVTPGKIIALFDSHGHIEIAVNGGSAALTLACRTGDEVVVLSSKSQTE
jgi:hypothetical protein